MWEEITTDIKSVNSEQKAVLLRDVPALKNKKSGKIRVYPAEVAKAEIRDLANQYGLEPRQIPILLMLFAKPGIFREGMVHFKYHMNKMLFYQLEEMRKQKIGETYHHDDFVAAKRGPVPVSLDEDLTNLKKLGLVNVTLIPFGKGKKEASKEIELTKQGFEISGKLWKQIPEPLRDTTLDVKKDLFPLSTNAIKEKVHEEYPQYRKMYVEVDLD